MKENLDDGESETSDEPNPNCPTNSQFHDSINVDSLIDDLLKSSSRTCTHTHTCNPPGPTSAHTHTCHHTHTQFLASQGIEDRTAGGARSGSKSGNQEAVRKYREKKKAHVARLEEEAKKLRAVNGQLVRRLRRQAVLEAEAERLRGLLADLRAKIDNALGDFPFQKQCDAAGLFELESDDGPWKGNCQPVAVDGRANGDENSSGVGVVSQAVEALALSRTRAK